MQCSAVKCSAVQRNDNAMQWHARSSYITKLLLGPRAYHYLGTLLGTCSRYDVVPCTSDRICESLLPKQCTESLLHQVTPTNIFISAGCTFMHGNTVIGENECVRKEMRVAHSV